jgi:ABC-type enterochelin transport system substrate-binding protein
MSKSAKELQQEVERLQAELKAAKAPKPAKLSLKVSEKGAISLYGNHSRFPTTLYRKQWENVASFMPQILEFIEENKDRLSSKDDA